MLWGWFAFRVGRPWVYVSAGIIIVMVASSRVYLGVHWPTDVLGGWTLGAAWALCCWWAVGKLAEPQPY